MRRKAIDNWIGRGTAVVYACFLPCLLNNEEAEISSQKEGAFDRKKERERERN